MMSGCERDDLPLKLLRRPNILDRQRQQQTYVRRQEQQQMHNAGEERRRWETRDEGLFIGCIIRMLEIVRRSVA